MSGRRLMSIRRWIEPEARAAYDAAWERFRVLAEAQALHAWRFESAEIPLLHMEFLESPEDLHPLLDPSLSALLRELDGIGTGEVEEWVGG